MERGDRELLESNIRREAARGFEFDSLTAVLRDLASRVGDHAMVAFGRLSSEFDNIEHEEIYSEHPKARPVAAVMVRIKEGANQAELDEYMAKVVPIMGFEGNLEKVKYGDYTYSATRLTTQLLDYAHTSPCFVLANGYLVLTTNEAYMRLVLDAIANPRSATLAADPTFQVTMGAVPEKGQVGIFIDLEKVTRIPASTRDGAGPPGTRGFLWDQRNDWVQIEKDTREEAIRYRAQLHKERGKPRTRQEEDAIDELVDARMSIWARDLYPGFEEERRIQIEQWRRGRGIGIVLGADAETINAHFSLVFREGEEWLRWTK